MRKSLFAVTCAGIMAVVLAVVPAGASYAAGSVQKVTKTVHAATVNGTYAFSPAKLTIHVGTKVVWINSTPAPHTITGKGHWTINKQLPTGQSVSVTFTKTGTYHYYCAIHPYMVATITVLK